MVAGSGRADPRGGGGRAASSPAEHVAELVAALPHGRSVTLDTGHEVHDADPVGFIREVRAFLDVTSTYCELPT